MPTLVAAVAALIASGCLAASPGQPGDGDAGGVADAPDRDAPDASACEVAFLDEFDRDEIGDQWQYFGGGMEYVERTVSGDRLTIVATGGPEVGNPDHYAFGIVHMVAQFDVATHTIEAVLDAEPGESGDVFFGWNSGSLYLGMQGLSTGSMTVVSGMLGEAESRTLHCSGCVNFDVEKRHWRARPAADGIVFEMSPDRVDWTTLTTVGIGDLPFGRGAPAVWAECDPTFTARMATDSVTVSVCP